MVRAVMASVTSLSSTSTISTWPPVTRYETRAGEQTWRRSIGYGLIQGWRTYLGVDAKAPQVRFKRRAVPRRAVFRAVNGEETELAPAPHPRPGQEVRNQQKQAAIVDEPPDVDGARQGRVRLSHREILDA